MVFGSAVDLSYFFVQTSTLPFIDDVTGPGSRIAHLPANERELDKLFWHCWENHKKKTPLSRNSGFCRGDQGQFLCVVCVGPRKRRLDDHCWNIYIICQN